MPDTGGRRIGRERAGFRTVETPEPRNRTCARDAAIRTATGKTQSGSFVLLILATVLGIFQTAIKTVRLDIRQWLICTAVALSVVAAAEIRRAMRRRAAAKVIQAACALRAGATTR